MSNESSTVRNMAVLAFLAVAVATGVIIAHRLPAGKCEERKDCSYDIESLKKTDPALLIKSGVSFVKPQLANLSAIAVDHFDNVYIGGSSGVEVHDKDGKRISGFQVSGRVNCMAVTINGDILLGVKNRIEIRTKGGSRKDSWECPEPKAELTSIAAYGDFVYAADCVNRIVWKFTGAGELSGKIGGKDNDKRKEGFVVPSAFFDVAVANDGSVWVANPGMHRVEHFSAEGAFLSCWGSASLKADGFCGCCNPSNIAMMPDGWFVTSEKHIVRVKIYDPEGKFIGIVSGQEQWQKEAVGLDIAVDSKFRILVLDPQSGVVRIYTRSSNGG